MSVLYNNKEKLHGKIYQYEKCIGSCVPFVHQERAYAITCHHVLFGGKETTDQLALENLTVTINSINYPLLRIVTAHEVSSKCDVLIVELTVSSSDKLKGFVDIVLSTKVDAEHILKHNHGLIVCHPNENQIAKVLLNSQARDCGEYDIESTVEKGTFYNLGKARGGAKEYAGISGSGLFMSIGEKTYLLALLSKLPDGSITETVVLKRLDSIATMFGESKLFFDIVELTREPTGKAKAPLKDVCFVNYTERSKDYYYPRSCDSEFNANLDDSMNTWLHGESGSGKTALVARNLMQRNVHHIACDLEPITIDSCDSIFRGMIDDITQFTDIDETPDNLDVKSISQFLQKCQFKDNTVITIDEMSCTRPDIIEQFCQKAMLLVRHYQKLEPDKNIVFVISSIFDPKVHGCHRGKLIESFDIICSNNWSNDIENLLDVQNDALGNMICENGKQIILKNCDNLPRLLTKMVQRVYRSKDFSVESITLVVERVISEYKEHE
ncbi:ATP-binding protein [Vibrio harveyi]|uniref:ATP-binding protein n=1 Tax=Vibrio TaxID=662 RepID=UPI0022CD6228|nr:ATP-binding protein [Vibrio sp. NFR]ELI0637186.1 ATP-binding protein [Vibrio harveyi]MDA0134732.1 ATP-binding protein [Vibrio sp. NFR]